MTESDEIVSSLLVITNRGVRDIFLCDNILVFYKNLVGIIDLPKFCYVRMLKHWCLITSLEQFYSKKPIVYW